MNDQCVSCKKCVPFCPVACFEVEEKEGKDKVTFDPSLCLGCGVCERVCKLDAIEMVKEKNAYLHLLIPFINWCLKR